MKKNFFIDLIIYTLPIIVIFSFWCLIYFKFNDEPPSDIKTEIQSLENSKKDLIELNNNLIKCNLELENKIKIKNNLINGKPVRYMLELKLFQSRFSLDIGEHIKDGLNKTTFTMETSESFYNQVSAGDSLFKKFRNGSFWVEGSCGSWNIVVNKKFVSLE